MSVAVTEIEKNYRDITARIAAAARAAGRDPAEITLIAVSKKQPEDKIEALYRLGHRDFGENYVQELVSKAGELERRGCPGIRWHFIGHLQTNKAKLLAPYVSAVHSVDSERVAAALARQWTARAERGGGALPIFIEVNISGEASKTGVAPDAVSALAKSVAGFSELELQGLMCVPSVEESAKNLAQRFEQLKSMESALGAKSRRMLSMGMSSDFEVAIRHGATHVRVGTALFGAR